MEELRRKAMREENIVSEELSEDSVCWEIKINRGLKARVLKTAQSRSFNSGTDCLDSNHGSSTY